MLLKKENHTILMETNMNSSYLYVTNELKILLDSKFDFSVKLNTEILSFRFILITAFSILNCYINIAFTCAILINFVEWNEQFWVNEQLNLYSYVKLLSFLVSTTNKNNVMEEMVNRSGKYLFDFIQPRIDT